MEEDGKYVVVLHALGVLPQPRHGADVWFLTDVVKVLNDGTQFRPVVAVGRRFLGAVVLRVEHEVGYLPVVLHRSHKPGERPGLNSQPDQVRVLGGVPVLLLELVQKQKHLLEALIIREVAPGHGVLQNHNLGSQHTGSVELLRLLRGARDLGQALTGPDRAV